MGTRHWRQRERHAVKAVAAWLVDAQRLANQGMRTFEIARTMGRPRTTISWQVAKGHLLLQVKRGKRLGAKRVQSDGSVLCLDCGKTKPAAEVVFALDRGKLRPVRCKVCKVTRTRNYRHQHGVMPFEEYRALTLRTRASAQIVRASRRAQRDADNKERLAPLVAEAERRGVTVRAIRYAKRYHDDPAFRGRQRLRKQYANHAHPERAYQYTATRAARILAQADGTITIPFIRRLFTMTSECAYCETGLTQSNKVLDHMNPLALGGAHSTANVLVCCRACNCRKHSKPFALWLASLPDSIAARFADHSVAA